MFLLLLAVFVIFVLGPEEEELRRVTSPDGTTDAVVYSVSGGGAAGYAYQYLYLTPAGEPAQEGELALTPKSYPDGGFRLRWRDERMLVAGPRSAPGAVLRKTYRPGEMRGRQYSVEWWAETGSDVPWDADSTP